MTKEYKYRSARFDTTYNVDRESNVQMTAEEAKCTWGMLEKFVVNVERNYRRRAGY